MKLNMDKSIKYIFVDLDGTLINTDLLFETFLKFIKRNPLNIFLCFLWLAQGKATLKERLAREISLTVENLPYHEQLLEYLIKKKDHGHKLVLATASNSVNAKKISDYLNIFSDIISSDAYTNMKGENKLSAIKDYSEGEPFAYAGDNKADQVIWNEADFCIFVNVPEKLIAKSNNNKKASKMFSTPGLPKWQAFLKEMRMHQWVKNILVLIPLFTSHTYTNTEMLFDTAIAFLCLCLCASGGYFLNDLLDLDADRQHDYKKYRPLASGELSIFKGIIGAALLPLASIGLAFVYLPIYFTIILLMYYMISIFYSFYLKRFATIDVMTLAILYTLRVGAGAIAIDVELSSWLLAFSMFIFVSLSYLKRFVELSNRLTGLKSVPGRGYTSSDAESMFSLGVSNLTAAVVVLALYINNPDIIIQQKTPEILWGMCFLLLYWGNRLWIQARRGDIKIDPVLFIIKDNISRLVGVAFLIIVLVAKFINLN